MIQVYKNTSNIFLTQAVLSTDTGVESTLAPAAVNIAHIQTINME